VNTFELANGRRWAQVNYVPDLDPDGRVKGIFVLTYDVTEQRQAQEDLRRSEEQFRRLFEDAPVGIAVGGLVDGIESTNEALRQMLGYSEEDIRGLSLAELTHPEDKQKGLGLSKGLLEGKLSKYSLERRFVHKDGHDVEGLLEVSLTRDEDGTPDMVMSMVRDVTEQKRMEEELLKTQKLESIGVLAGGIAHDFNNLLTAVMGNLSLARLETPPGTHLTHLLVEAEQACKRATDLTSQLLTFARGGEPIKCTLAFAPIILEAVRFASRGTGVSCSFDFPADLWAVEVDEGQMNQVFHNLTVNACQAMPGGGTINITAKNLELAPGGIVEPQLRPGKYVEVSIADVGCGITKCELPKIFDPFFSSKPSGSGLGLATTYSIIKRHGGHVKALSEPGMGCVFTIYLPASEVVGTERVQVDLAFETGHGKILIMDDEASVRLVSEQLLTRLGYKNEMAVDGAQAIEMFGHASRSSDPFDLVILDLTIPGGMGGIKCLKSLREIDPAVKAAVSSGYSTDPVMSDHESYGFNGVLPKPFTITELAKVLLGVLEDRNGTVGPESEE
jgi:two-component system cell cycle sensor histidine kinase/response regulator CckA